MREIILTCDLCKAEKGRHGKRSYAVATLDVCQAHHRRYGQRRGRMRTKQDTPAIERRREADRERKRVARVERARVNEPAKPKQRSDKGTERSDWSGRQALVLAEIPSVGSIGARELQKRVLGTQKMKRGAYVTALKLLKAKGFVTMRGSRSRASYLRAHPGGTHQEAVGG